MASKETERMIKLGEWLESYLNPDIKAREYRRLATAFIKLYDVDFELQKNDLIINFLELLEKSSDEDKRFYQDPKSLPDEEVFGTTVEEFFEINPLSRTQNGKDPLQMKPFWEKLLSEDQVDDINFIHNVISITTHILFPFWHNKKYVIGLLEAICNSRNNWGNILFEEDECVHTESGLEDDADHSLEGGLYELGNRYSELGENLAFNLTNREVSVKKQFIGPEQKYDLDHLNSISVFRWDVAVARVFLDFLQLGGQNHIHFCKQCGRFTVIKRKGRKEYCSSLCRVRASNERIAQAGV